MSLSKHSWVLLQFRTNVWLDCKLTSNSHRPERSSPRHNEQLKTLRNGFAGIPGFGCLRLRVEGRSGQGPLEEYVFWHTRREWSEKGEHGAKRGAVY